MNRHGAPAVVHEVLASAGQPLDVSTHALMQRRFGHNFGEVRVHTGARAAESARAVDALAYTVGRDIVFEEGQYRPATPAGRQLLAHELTHVIQQRNAASKPTPDRALTLDAADGAAEREAQRMGAAVAGDITPAPNTSVQPLHGVPTSVIARADPQAIRLTRQLGRTVATGIRFWPANVTDTQVGPVSVQGGLLSGGASRLHIIIGGNLTLRALAAELRPLWITATPFTPLGAGAPLPLDIISQDELAQALLVYNQTHLPVPAMTNWRAGLRLPLPAEIDELTGIATVHPLQIKALAAAYDPAWAPLLDQRAAGLATVPAATLAADVTAFLGREPTASARGIHLAARAATNATAELPFLREVFSQLGAASFDVALAFMNNLVNREIQVLASQRDGAAILAAVRTALAAAPAVRTPAQQEQLDRANLMLGLVAGVAAVAPPAATRARPQKTLTIDTVRLSGSTHNPATDVAIANAIFAQCNIQISHVANKTATHAQTVAWLHGNIDLADNNNCAVNSPDVSSLVVGATADFGLGARVRAFFPATFSGVPGRGFSCPASLGPVATKRNTIVVQNTGTERTLAHEIGHILLDPGPHPGAATHNVMVPTAVAPLAMSFTNPDCITMYGNV